MLEVNVYKIFFIEKEGGKEDKLLSLSLWLENLYKMHIGISDFLFDEFTVAIGS